MPIAQTQTTSFKVELFQAVHNFTTSTGDTFYLALYEATSNIGASTTVYTTTGEVTGTGYTAGGKVVTALTPIASGTTALVSFNNVTWTGASFIARGGLIYNASKGNKTVCVIDFGADKTATPSIPFVVTMPAQVVEQALLQYA